MNPCPQCRPDECHGNSAPIYDHPPHNGVHVRRQAKTHDGQIIDYCVYCLVRLKFLHDRWQSDIIVEEWP